MFKSFAQIESLLTAASWKRYHALKSIALRPEYLGVDCNAIKMARAILGLQLNLEVVQSASMHEREPHTVEFAARTNIKLADHVLNGQSI